MNEKIASEPAIQYNSPPIFDLQLAITPTGLSPIIKWPGGKESELKYIFPRLPRFDRYIEPFVGGGSVFMSVASNEYLINDFSEELIALYRCIASLDSAFFAYVSLMDEAWLALDDYLHQHPQLIDIYLAYRQGITDSALSSSIKVFCHDNLTDLRNLIANTLHKDIDNFIKEINANLLRKMKRMLVLEREKWTLPDQDIYSNILTALKSALYMYFRKLYNDCAITAANPTLHCALFFFIRNYAYSGMFRYSKNGSFNVPYGGIAYNSKRLSKKLQYYNSSEVTEHFRHTQIFNLDFEEFLRAINPRDNDFIFLDPPYDSEFSTYARNQFTRNDQQRLANYLLHECKAKWMLVIKNTEFIFDLYNHPGVHISQFDKSYTVSFMNRNNRDVTHLLITNYKPSPL